jgi:hypothetical protein
MTYEGWTLKALFESDGMHPDRLLGGGDPS